MSDERYQADVDQAERKQIMIEYEGGMSRTEIMAKHRLNYRIVYRITLGMPHRNL